MKKTFSAQEHDAFAKAVSAVEGLALTTEQTIWFEKFDQEKVALQDQVDQLKQRYSVRK
jgi:hypothetical protein